MGVNAHKHHARAVAVGRLGRAVGLSCVRGPGYLCGGGDVVVSRGPGDLLSWANTRILRVRHIRVPQFVDGDESEADRNRAYRHSTRSSRDTP